MSCVPARTRPRLVANIGAVIGAMACLAGGVDSACSQSTDRSAFKVQGLRVTNSVMLDVAEQLSVRTTPAMITATGANGYYATTYAITLHFKADRDPEDVKRLILSVLGAHPAGRMLLLSQPQGDELPVLSIALSSDTLASDELFDYVAAEIQPRLTSVETVDRVAICSKARRGLQIHPDPSMWERLFGHADMHTVLAHAIQQFNAEKIGGTMSRDGDTYTIEARAGYRWTGIASLQELQIAVRDGLPVRLRDFATVTLGPVHTSDLCLYEGMPAVIVQVDIRRNLASDAVLARLRQEVDAIPARLPQGVRMSVFPDRVLHGTKPR